MRGILEDAFARGLDPTAKTAGAELDIQVAQDNRGDRVLVCGQRVSQTRQITVETLVLRIAIAIHNGDFHIALPI